MSISQTSFSRFFPPNGTPKIQKNNTFVNSQTLFEYSNLNSNNHNQLYTSKDDDSININNIKKENIMKKDEYSNLNVDDKKEENNNTNKVNIRKKTGDKEDFITKWKTEKCHNMEIYGQCKFGENCAFAHGDDELKEKVKNFNYKTKLCKQFFEEGFCPYGSRCQFNHKIKNYDFYYKFYNKLIVDNENYIIYNQIIPNLLCYKQISLKAIKRPRLLVFKNIANFSQTKVEENRLKLYLDIIKINDKVQKLNC